MKTSVLLILQRNHTCRFSSFKNTLRCLMRYLDLACRLGNFSTILRVSPYEITFFTVHYEAFFFFWSIVFFTGLKWFGIITFARRLWWVTQSSNKIFELPATFNWHYVKRFPKQLLRNRTTWIQICRHALLTTKLMPIQTVKNTSVVWFYHLKSIPPFLKLTVLRADNSKH